MNAELNRNHMKQKQGKTLNTTQQLINLTNQKMKLSRSKARKWKDRYKTKQYIFLCFCTTIHIQKSKERANNSEQTHTPLKRDKHPQRKPTDTLQQTTTRTQPSY